MSECWQGDGEGKVWGHSGVKSGEGRGGERY